MIARPRCSAATTTRAANPRVIFGRLLRYYRTRAKLSQEQLGSLVYMTGDMIAKVERGDRGASDKLVDALETLPELAPAGTLRLLWDQLREHFTDRPFPGWFAMLIGSATRHGRSGSGGLSWPSSPACSKP